MLGTQGHRSVGNGRWPGKHTNCFMTNCCVRGFPNLHGSVHMAKGQNQNCTFFTDKGRASTSAAEMKADQFPAIPLPNGAGRGPRLNPKTMLCQHCQELPAPPARQRAGHIPYLGHIFWLLKNPLQLESLRFTIHTLALEEFPAPKLSAPPELSPAPAWPSSCTQTLNVVQMHPPMQHPSIILNTTTKNGTQHFKMKMHHFSTVTHEKAAVQVQMSYKCQSQAIPYPTFWGPWLITLTSVKSFSLSVGEKDKCSSGAGKMTTSHEIMKLCSWQDSLYLFWKRLIIVKFISSPQVYKSINHCSI